MRLITVTFPVLHYFPPHESDGHVLTCILRNSPAQLCPREVPVTSSYCPGGIIDLTGLDLPIVHIKGAFHKAPWWALMCNFGLYRRLEFIYGVPHQLTVDEVRKKYTRLILQQRGFSRNMKRLKEATTYREIFASQWDDKVVNRYDPPLTMEIEVPDK